MTNNKNKLARFKFFYWKPFRTFHQKHQTTSAHITAQTLFYATKYSRYNILLRSVQDTGTWYPSVVVWLVQQLIIISHNDKCSHNLNPSKALVSPPYPEKALSVSCSFQLLILVIRCSSYYTLHAFLGEKLYGICNVWGRTRSPDSFLPSYPGYFREPHWKSMTPPEMPRVICDRCAASDSEPMKTPLHAIYGIQFASNWKNTERFLTAPHYIKINTLRSTSEINRGM